MPTCWCRVERSRYWQAHATTFPAPDRPRDPRSRTARSRMRGGLAPRRERLCGLIRPSPLVRVLFPGSLEPIDKIGKPVGDALIYDVVVHRTQLLAEAGLYISAQLGRFPIGFFFMGCPGFHLFLFFHGLSFFHFSTPPPSQPLSRHRLPPNFPFKTRCMA